MKTILLVIAIAVPLAACGSDHNLLNSRMAEWKAMADAQIPAGRTIEEVKAWASTLGFTFSLREPQRQLYAIVERVPESGLNKYICSHWSITLTVNLSPQDETTTNEVDAVGTCL